MRSSEELKAEKGTSKSTGIFLLVVAILSLWVIVGLKFKSIFLYFGLLWVFGFFAFSLVFLRTSKTLTAEIEKAEVKESEEKEKLSALGVIKSEYGLHIEGLPNVGREACLVAVRDKDLLIKSANTEFTLKYEQLFNAVVTADKETIQTIKTESKSNAGKALAGGLLFGTTGAVIGAASKPKINMSSVSTEITRREYLAINYNSSNGQIKTLVFEFQPNTLIGFLESEINNRIPQQAKIEL